MKYKFDTEVQFLKYRVLKAVARHLYNDTLEEGLIDIQKEIVPGPKPHTRCCIYKERAIVNERVKLALGGDKENKNVIEVIDIACDECPVAGYNVTDSCRGCLAHRCQSVCKFGAIYFDRNQKAHIDKEKCVECGACSKVCPYTAIKNSKRPCETACKVAAIKMDENRTAKIDNDKCIQCGACVYQCPWGAIMDKSSIKEIIRMFKSGKNVVAVVAPAIASQYYGIKLGQVITGIKHVGFTHVVEAALGADLVAYHEAQELVEKGFLTTSCCPAFVSYVKKFYPNVAPKVSSNLSPMAMISKHIKEVTPDAYVVFVGPCTAKKAEVLDERVKQYVDAAMTFEELQALFGALEIDLETLEESSLDDASYFGRVFGRSGGVTEAVRQALKEQNSDFAFNPLSCDGIENLKVALLRANKNLLPNNFLEGMACVGGCIGGPCALNHEIKNKLTLEKHCATSTKDGITDAINKISNLDL